MGSLIVGWSDRRMVFQTVPLADLPRQRLVATRAQARVAAGEPEQRVRNETGARVYEVVLVAGTQNGWTFSAAVLEAAAPLFNGATVFCDHSVLDGGNYVAYPSARNVVGVISGAHVAEGQLRGNLHVSPSADWLAGLLDFCIELQGQGLTPPDVGMSADISFTSEDWTVQMIYKVWSVDVVFDPAAGGGTILRALNGNRDVTGDKGQGTSSHDLSRQFSEGGEMKKFWRQAFAFEADKDGAGGGVAADGTGAPAQTSGALQTSAVVQTNAGQKTVTLPEEGQRAQAAQETEDRGRAQMETQLKTQQQAQDLLRMQCETTLNTQLAASDLPEVHKAVIREKFEGRVFDASELKKEFEWHRKIFAANVEKTTVQGAGAREDKPVRQAFVGGMVTDLERVAFAAEKLLSPREFWSNQLAEMTLPTLTGVRELYLAVTGDYEFRGAFNGDRSQFANGTASTMASIVANLLNKVVKAKWAELQPTYGWWKKIVTEEDFNTLQTVDWVTVGGFGDLPTVSEGAAYTELVWDDNAETAAWVKKGGYIGVTLEMMDRDQTRKVRQIPLAMATAGMRTLSASIGNIFTQASGAGPNLADGTALFHSTSANRGGDGSTAASGNLSTTALSAAEWDVHIQKTYAKKELNSARRLGLRPKYVVIPIELEKTALGIFTSQVEPTTNVFYSNVRVSGAENVVVCPEFTDTNDWASVVDPSVYPCLGVGYRFGREPEVFQAGDEVVGSMFTNDELRVKSRFFYAAGVIDWRGLRKANV